MTQNKNTLDFKERAYIAALKLNKGLITEDSSIYMFDKEGNREKLSDANDHNSWQKVLSKLESRINDTNAGKLIIYTDGGSRGNPGPSASGYVVTNDEGQVIEEGGEYLGVTTNNQAEYQAVKLGLEKVAKITTSKVEFKIDSLLVVNQLNGKYKIKNKELWPVHQAIKEKCKLFKEVTFIHVRREFNKLADAKVNEILDTYISNKPDS